MPTGQTSSGAPLMLDSEPIAMKVEHQPGLDHIDGEPVCGMRVIHD